MPTRQKKEVILSKLNQLSPECPILVHLFFSISAEPDSGGFAWNDQSAGWRPAGRHRAPNQGHAYAVRHQGELPAAGCVSG